MKNKIYMAGCGGMLGEAFYRVFSGDYEIKCTDIDVNDTWLTKLDFRNLNEYSNDVNTFKPDYLFHIGAHTDLEYCETNQDDAYNTNTRAVENAVNISNKLDIPVIHGVENKIKQIEFMASKNQIDLKKTMYIGNDINDFFAMQRCEFSACPADGHKRIIEISNFICKKNGGEGIAREILEDLFKIDLI